MKKGLSLLMKLSLVALFAICGLASCTKEYYDVFNDTFIVGTESFNAFFVVKKDQWVWNPNTHRYERYENIRELDQYIYDNGTTIVSVFLPFPDGSEKQTALPYPQAHLLADSTIIENIGYEVTLGNPTQICFFMQYVQGSELVQVSNFLDDFEFKVSLIWEEPN